MTDTALRALVLACACVLTACTQPKPACAPDSTLAEIEAAYVAEIMFACDGQHFDTCVERVKIDKRYDALRKEWVTCHE